MDDTQPITNPTQLTGTNASNRTNLTNSDLHQGGILDSYRQPNQTENVFWMKAETTDIYLMDFKQNRFVKE